MKRSVTIGPFGVWFTNRNQAMGLRAHSHFAEVTVTFGHPPDVPGFPAFAVTNEAMAALCRSVLAGPVTGTNEDVLAALWAALADQRPGDAPFSDWGGCTWWLQALELAVRGVPDGIGHHDSFTRYRMEV